MIKPKEKCLKKGVFKGMTYVCARKYLCQKGELTLTEKNLIVSCRGHWSKTIPVMEVRLEGLRNSLSVRTILYNRLLFTLTVDQAEEWEKALGEIIFDRMKDVSSAFANSQPAHQTLKSSPLLLGVNRFLNFNVASKLKIKSSSTQFLGD